MTLLTDPQAQVMQLSLINMLIAENGVKPKTDAVNANVENALRRKGLIVSAKFRDIVYDYNVHDSYLY